MAWAAPRIPRFYYYLVVFTQMMLHILLGPLFARLPQAHTHASAHTHAQKYYVIKLIKQQMFPH